MQEEDVKYPNELRLSQISKICTFLPDPNDKRFSPGTQWYVHLPNRTTTGFEKVPYFFEIRRYKTNDGSGIKQKWVFVGLVVIDVDYVEDEER